MAGGEDCGFTLPGILAVAIVGAVSSFWVGARAQAVPEQDTIRASRPVQATRCDLSVPLQVSLTTLSELRPGSTARFSVAFTSGVDPDLVKRMWIEYEVPERLKSGRSSFQNSEIPRTIRSSRQELELPVPDRGRYEVRARLVVELTNGRKISKTATQWINPENVPPEGVTGRIVGPDGTGIQVYRGVTVRNRDAGTSHTSSRGCVDWSRGAVPCCVRARRLHRHRQVSVRGPQL